MLSTTESQSRLFLRKTEPITSVPNLPLLHDLRAAVIEVPFGQSGRCDARRSDADIIVNCAAGTDPAGMLLRFAGKLPPGASIEAVVVTDGSDGFGLQIVKSGNDATAAIPASGQQSLRLPRQTDAAIHLVILAPEQGGVLRLTDLRLAPTRTPRALDAGAWVWQPEAWRENGEALVRNAVERGLKHLYITLVIADGEVQHTAELASFIRAAANAKIAIEAVEGDPRMVLREGLSSALARARAIARFQKHASADAQLSGIQYDIEPYVLPDWGTSPVDHEAWSAAVNALAQASGGPVHLVLPFWIANEPAGAQFLRDVEASVNAVTIMSYRTDGLLAPSLAEPLLQWGGIAGKPVRIALEAGPVASEIEERFVPATSGQLALIETDGLVTATFYPEATMVAGAAMYASQGKVRTQSDRISFLGKEQQMLEAAEQVARAASAWDAFAGISFHGLALSER